MKYGTFVILRLPYYIWRSTLFYSLFSVSKSEVEISGLDFLVMVVSDLIFDVQSGKSELCFRDISQSVYANSSILS
jgi:hypothetical protein